MAMIVKHKSSNGHFVLVGVGFGAYSSARPGAFFGDWLPAEKSGEITMAAVAFPDGRILWCDTKELELVSIDGQSVRDVLKPFLSAK